MTFLFTWIFWIIAFTSTSLSLNGSFRIIGSFVPSIMSIIFTGYYYGVNGIKRLLKKLTIWRINPLFYAFIFLFTATSIYIPSFICNTVGMNYIIHINNHISSFQLTSPLTILICFFAVMIFGGPVGEELGWRGFVLPKLEKKVNPFISSIILGVIWTCWHIPMFYFHVPGYDISFISYLLETIWLTILFTWLYNNTKGSLLIIILYHSVDNFVMAVCFNDFMEHFNTYSVIFWIMRLIVLLCIVFDMFRKPLKQLKYENT
ncbi:CPBP family intramembrane glutamic endopeptidase [Haloimpatiens sp. FM7330]|uniref:CPBP family intramembrane glutamic endopeptidase n=1 Tax=Haloimpatiens sp. FM7330 TaxID=3298610 RepID=UPI0036429003